MSDIDECEMGVCHSHADCSNSIGGFQCICHQGFTGDGNTSCTGMSPEWIESSVLFSLVEINNIQFKLYCKLSTMGYIQYVWEAWIEDNYKLLY